MTMDRRTFLKATGTVLLLPAVVSARSILPDVVGELPTELPGFDFTHNGIINLCKHVGAGDVAVETNMSKPYWVRVRVEQKVGQVRRVLESYKPMYCELEVTSF